MIKRTVLIGLVVVAIMALTVSTALAAKGVITEVNPSWVRVVDGITDVEVIELKEVGRGGGKKGASDSTSSR